MYTKSVVTRFHIGQSGASDIQIATACFVRHSATSSSNHVLWRNSIEWRVLFQCRNVLKNFSSRSMFFLKNDGNCHTTAANRLPSGDAASRQRINGSSTSISFLLWVT